MKHLFPETNFRQMVLDKLAQQTACSSKHPPVMRACHCCGLVHQVPVLELTEQATCVRCGSVIDSGGRSGSKSAARCLAAAVGGLVLYFPAILLPILEIERLGHHHSASLLGGTLDLVWNGNLLVGVIVLVFSIILPMLKLLALIELSSIGIFRKRHRAWTYRMVEWAGRWSMMDVLLLALLVALVKLGELVTFQLGPAVIAFVLCVLMSMAASIAFDPHAIWEDEPELA